MSETTTETEGPDLFDAPKDVDEGEATGHALYDRTLGQFVGPVVKAKGDASKGVTKVDGHRYVTVRV